MPARSLSCLLLLLLLGPPVGADEIEELIEQLDSTEADDVEKAVETLLGRRDLAAVRALVGGLGSRHTFTRDHVYVSWQERPSDEAIDWIVAQGLADEEPRVRRNLASLLARWQVAPAAGALGALRVRDRDLEVRIRSARALAALGDAGARKNLEKQLRSREWEERIACLEALAALGWDEARSDVDKALRSDRSPQVRVAALLLVAERSPEDALERATRAARDASWQVRAAAFRVLVDLREKDGVQILIDALDKESGRLEHDAWFALRRLTGKEIPCSADAWQVWWDANEETFDLSAVEDKPAPDGESNTVVTYYGIDIYSDRIAFLVDSSGSMRQEENGETRLAKAKKTLVETLGRLGPGKFFNVILFKSVIVPWQKSLQRVSPRSVQSAIDYIEKQEAETKGNLFDALIAIQADPNVDTVFVLTDGSPTGGEYQDMTRVLEEFERRNRYCRLEIHTVLIREGAGRRIREFMQEMADSTGGRSVHR